MRAGGLRSLVVIERRETTRDPETNEPLVTWVEFAQAYAGTEAKSGKEFFADGQRHAQVVWHCTFRPDDVAGVTSDMRIKIDGGEPLSISAILPGMDARSRTLIHAVSEAGGD